MGVLERRAREKEALRSKILEAATSLFVEQGYENVSIRKIADRIEYSPATIYLYFKDKAELITAICEDAFGEMLEQIGAAKDGASDPVQSLRLGLRCYIQFGLSHPNHYLIIFATQAYDGTDATCKPNGLAMQTFDLLRDSIRSCIQVGAIPPSDVETAAQATWMTVHGVTMLGIAAGNQSCDNFPWLDRTHLIESALDVIIAGLRNCTLPPPVR